MRPCHPCVRRYASCTLPTYTLNPDCTLNPTKPWPQALDLWWGYLRMEVNATHLAAQVVSDEDGGLMDSLTLTKPAGWGRGFMQRRRGAGGAAAAAAAAS